MAVERFPVFETHPPTAIRHIACPYGSNTMFATGEWEHTVSVWSFEKRRELATFNTVLDSGGRRLALVLEPRPIVVAGAFQRYGIWGYDALTGEPLWARRDLKKVQHLQPFPNGRVAAGFDLRSLQILEAATGETVSKLRGLEELHVGSDARYAIGVPHSGYEWVGLYDLEAGKRMWQVALSSFTILDAALGRETLAFCEVTSAVRCLAYDGVEQWRWTSPSGEHVRSLSWSERADRFVGVLDPYEENGNAVLVGFDAAGDLASAIDIGEVVAADFMAGGDRLVVSTLDVEGMSEGLVLSVAGGAVEWRFRPPAPLSDNRYQAR